MKKVLKNNKLVLGNRRKWLLLGNVILALIIVCSLYFWNVREQGSRQAVRTSTEKTMGKRETAENRNSTGNETVKDNQKVDEAQETPAQSGEGKTSVVTPAPGFTLSMVGDVLLHAPVSRSGLQKNGSYNYDALFSHIKKDIKASDAALINQEVILAGEKFGITGYPAFNGRFQVGDAIEKAGFDVVLHATNHSMDRGKSGLLTCLKRWKKFHPRMKITGMYSSKRKAQKITYVKKDGICIAILNYTYGTNGLPLPGDMPYAVNLLSKDKIKRDVKKAKKKADFIVVCPHWGTEYQTKPDASQKMWCRYFLKLGVNLVIGTHPHVIQPVKWMKDNKGHRMLVYYSLGNYINASGNRYAGMFRQFCGGMAEVKLERNAGGAVVITKAKFVPLITHWIKGGKITTYKLSDYSQSKAAKNHLSVIDSSFSYKKSRKFFSQIIDRDFLSMDFSKK